METLVAIEYVGTCSSGSFNSGTTGRRNRFSGSIHFIYVLENLFKQVVHSCFYCCRPQARGWVANVGKHGSSGPCWLLLMLGLFLGVLGHRFFFHPPTLLYFHGQAGPGWL